MIYREIYFDKGNGEKGCGVIFIQYGLGVRVALEGIESIFDEDKGFTDYMKDYADSNFPLYVDDEGDDIEVITMPTLIDAVYHAETPQTITLFNLLQEVENSLVNVWG